MREAMITNLAELLLDNEFNEWMTKNIYEIEPKVTIGEVIAGWKRYLERCDLPKIIKMEIMEDIFEFEVEHIFYDTTNTYVF